MQPPAGVPRRAFSRCTAGTATARWWRCAARRKASPLHLLHLLRRLRRLVLHPHQQQRQRRRRRRQVCRPGRASRLPPGSSRCTADTATVRWWRCAAPPNPSRLQQPLPRPPPPRLHRPSPHHQCPRASRRPPRLGRQHPPRRGCQRLPPHACLLLRRPRRRPRQQLHRRVTHLQRASSRCTAATVIARQWRCAVPRTQNRTLRQRLWPHLHPRRLHQRLPLQHRRQTRHLQRASSRCTAATVTAKQWRSAASQTQSRTRRPRLWLHLRLRRQQLHRRRPMRRQRRASSRCIGGTATVRW